MSDFLRGHKLRGAATLAVIVTSAAVAVILTESPPGRALPVGSRETIQPSLNRLGGEVAFVIGASTDPNGDSRPRGFGVATHLLSGHVRILRERLPVGHPANTAWLSPNMLAVFGMPTGVRYRAAGTVFTIRRGGLEKLRSLPIRGNEWESAFSPDGKWLATVPYRSGSCGPGTRPQLHCTSPGGSIFVERSDGSDRHLVADGYLRGWTRDGRLLIFKGANTDFASGAYLALDIHSGRVTTLISSSQANAFAHARHAELGDLAFSHDGRYLAARATFRGKWAIVIARVHGGITNLITSKAVISMVAWSPRADELAYSTSGFPSPHELFVVPSPSAQPRRILSQPPHFDWLTWSPSGRWLLIDNQHLNEWELLHVTGSGRVAPRGGAAVPTRRLPRLGGMPTWCCAYANSAGA